MVDAWPAGLPQKLMQNGFAEAMADGLIEAQPDTGPPLTRLRTTSSPRPVGGTLTVTGEQLATLRDFVDTTLSHGSLPFEFPDQVRPGTLLVKFPKGALPSWRAVGGNLHRVTINLMVLP